MKIVQCWDDGVVDDARLCEMLRQMRCKATFNIALGLHHQTRRLDDWRYKNVKEVRFLSLGELRTVYNGFTIANHTLTHPMATETSLEDWRHDVVEGRKRLQDFFSQEIRGFAYPYGKYDKKSADAVRDAGHLYARTVGGPHVGRRVNDLMELHPDCNFESPAFWDLYENAKGSGAPFFYFFGHSYQFTSEDEWKSFEMKLERINNDPAVEWADLPEVMTAVSSEI